MKQLVADLAGKMTKQQWKKEQMDDPEIGPVIRLVDLLGPNEVLMEFEKETCVVEVGIKMHAMSEWDDFKVRTHCILAKRDSLINMCNERELSEREKQLLRDEKLQYQTQLGQVVDKIGSQIEQLDRKIEAEGPPIPFEIATPPSGSPRQEVQQLVMAPGLPHFSGTEPTQETKVLMISGSIKGCGRRARIQQ